MLKGNLLHPDILRALAAAGHGSKILIADSNYPISTHTGPNAEIAFLNLAPGKLKVTEVLKSVLGAVPVEGAAVMEPAILKEFRTVIGPLVEMEKLSREEFYGVARSEDLCLAIATGEQRIYACIILTIGVLT